MADETQDQIRFSLGGVLAEESWDARHRPLPGDMVELTFAGQTRLCRAGRAHVRQAGTVISVTLIRWSSDGAAF